MRNWSLVRTGSTSAQKSLFFNLRRVKAKIEAEIGMDGRDPTSYEIRREIAQELGVPLRDVDMMDARLSGADFSLNATQAGEEGREWVETLEDNSPQAEETVSRRSDLDHARGLLDEAFEALTERERMIITARKLADAPETLESLGLKLELSKERVRQLEAQALRKMRQRLEATHGAAAAELAATI
jgi:RNA polymerase sigma-32 factor